MFQVELTDIEDILPETDVLYMTRIQRERFQNEHEYKAVSVVLSPFNSEFTIVIFIHYKPRIAAALLDL